MMCDQTECETSPDETPISKSGYTEGGIPVNYVFGLTMEKGNPQQAGVPTHNLPAQTTSFVGRTQELDTIARLFGDPNVRLVTILALGGMGKTRLVLEAAEQQLVNFADGVYFVPLAPLESVDSIVPTIAAAVGLRFNSGAEPFQQLLAYLHDRKLLLVLDNFEHLLDGAGLVSEILQAATGIKVLVSSRERLTLSGETTFVVGGMDSPEPGIVEDALDFSSVQLFVQTCRRVRPEMVIDSESLKQIAKICSLTDGMPLAIVLASAWVAVLSLSEIADEITRNLDFLQREMRDVPERLHSIRAVFEATWRGLSQQEQTAFARLSVFRGGSSREAAMHVGEVSLHTLQSLIDKALLSRQEDGRYEIHELLRQYSEEQLAQTPDEHGRVRDRHCVYYAHHAQQSYGTLFNPDPKSWLVAMERNLENYLAGWDWACRNAHRRVLLQFIPSIDQFFYSRSRYREGVRIFAQAAAALEAQSSGQQPDVVLARLLADCAGFCSYTGELEMLEISYRKSLSLLRQVDDLGSHRKAVWCLWMQATALRYVRPAEARALFEECISYSRDHDYRELLVNALGNWFTLVSINLEDIPVIEEMLHLARQLGLLRYTALALIYRGLAAYHFEGNSTVAKSLIEEAITLYQRADDPFNLAIAHATYGIVVRAIGDMQAAKQAFLEALRYYDAFGAQPRVTPPTLTGCALLLASLGNQRGTAELCAFVQYDGLHVHQGLVTVSFLQVDPLAVLAELETELPPAVFVAAVERGRSLDMESAVKLALMMLEEVDILAVSELQVLNQSLTDPLTPREFEVLKHILAGDSNNAIAEELVISKNTLKTYISRLYSKLDVQNRSQAILRGRELGLLK